MPEQRGRPPVAVTKFQRMHPELYGRFARLEIGQSMFFPLLPGMADSISIINYVKPEAKRRGWRLRTVTQRDYPIPGPMRGILIGLMIHRVMPTAEQKRVQRAVDYMRDS